MKKVLSNYVVLEGIDGSGKTLKARVMADFFEKMNYDVLLTKEPGSPHNGINLDLRKILLNKNLPKTPKKEFTLMSMDRSIHIDNIVIPFCLQKQEINRFLEDNKNYYDLFKETISLLVYKVLNDNDEFDIEKDIIRKMPVLNPNITEPYENSVVISDRNNFSSTVYQGYGGNYDLNEIKKINTIVTQGIIPGITFIFDLDVKLAINRVKDPNYFEAKSLEDPEFFDRVRNGYLELARKKMVELINTEADFTTVINKTLDRLIAYANKNIPNFKRRFNFNLEKFIESETEKYSI
ncbi:thymidylate kinase [Patescibacteria group bacterium]|nr:thymidylate kinase [Patescibacteria group bacterium]